MTTLAATGLALARGNRPLFADLSFTLGQGEALVLRGANGSGKTSLLRVLAGLTQPDAGQVSWRQEEWRGLCAARRGNVLYAGHAQALKDDFNAYENLADLAAFDSETANDEALTAALERAGLSSRRAVPARRLSQGQKRRVCLARLALSTKPLWLLDEPTNVLDSEGVGLFVALLEHHLAGGGVACIATHLPLSLSAPIRELTMGATA